MRVFITGLLAAAALVAAQPAAATIVVGSFTGAVTEGVAWGNFGYATPTDIAGQRITGTFRYDTDLLGPNCGSSTSFLGCYLGTGMTITQTINGETEVFRGTPLPESLPFNTSTSGLVLYDLVGDAVNLHTLAMIGDPATVYNQHETALAFGFAPGGIGDTGNPVLDYDGASDGPFYTYRIGGRAFAPNRSQIYQLTENFFTAQSVYSFSVDHVTVGPAGVPEPTTWALMILGFGGAGAALRRGRRPALARTG